MNGIVGLNPTQKMGVFTAKLFLGCWLASRQETLERKLISLVAPFATVRVARFHYFTALVRVNVCACVCMCAYMCACVCMCV